MTDSWNLEIEKYWRDLFAEEIENGIMSLQDDETTKWFNEGMKHAARIVRYGVSDV